LKGIFVLLARQGAEACLPWGGVKNKLLGGLACIITFENVNSRKGPPRRAGAKLNTLGGLPSVGRRKVLTCSCDFKFKENHESTIPTHCDKIVKNDL
jgi:hypothetical protein